MAPFWTALLAPGCSTPGVVVVVCVQHIAACFCQKQHKAVARTILVDLRCCQGFAHKGFQGFARKPALARDRSNHVVACKDHCTKAAGVSQGSQLCRRRVHGLVGVRLCQKLVKAIAVKQLVPPMPGLHSILHFGLQKWRKPCSDVDNGLSTVAQQGPVLVAMVYCAARSRWCELGKPTAQHVTGLWCAHCSTTSTGLPS
jgi:hypothetical protein